MTEKDPIQTIHDALSEPIVPVEPAEIDVEAVGRYMTGRNGQILFPPYTVLRNAKLNLSDEVLKEKEE